MSPARRLARYRTTLVVFVTLTVSASLIATPTVWQFEEQWTRVDTPAPSTGAVLAACAVLLAWWASLVAVWVAAQQAPHER
jgi:uncharacterized membrane protein (DUF485 family)